ncbi:DUF5384 family protein [Pseudomonas shirazica]|jgi:uncharacterized sporulation protein YeaH/YhbH (DUF444 family)|uniref:DUF5384 family protein n=1 Tax=Pseudomonas TaxID=286 RepID=UPI00059F44E3|nr:MULTISPECIES: DUF5384 family protein [Pseudomonas]MDY4312825.1 DUF5384 family protein [Pseudomonas putida]AJG16814.1 hypothetical protein RK21_05306 [Pseudomonas plecoglossicida]MBF8789477.1 DUF5384 family protein [Pseudomonas asiatica]MDH0134802.1 DUF5384 family protein [Pseudomonas asiatica]MDY4322363.1 DUF5384 family protein [Pseudomonas putida]
MKHIVLGTALALSAATAMAGQFDQLYQIEQQTKQSEAALETERLRQAAAAEQRAEAREAAARQQRAAAQRASAQRAAEKQQAQAAERKRVQTREEAYEDDLRALELEERRLALQAKKAKVARANDYIDAELRDSAARTDVIQSNADSARNVTSGAKSLLEDSGKAEVKRAGSLFGE